MKKQKLTVAKWLGMGCLLASTMMTITGCSSSDDTTNDEDSRYANLPHSAEILTDGTQIGNGAKEFCFTGKETLKKGTYTLKGWVYCRPGSELTIEPGTVIKGDKGSMAALIIEPGAKIHATGTANAPIVFTSAQAKGSRKPGDWGGVIICGKATNNNGVMKQQIEGGPLTLHGGTDDADNSGELQYVRIEYAGYPFASNQEINGLTLGSVGSGTKLDHIQVSYSNDDSFEWFGGSVNAKYLIAYKGWDDDFDTDNGFHGSVQYGLAYRDSKIADQSMSNTFESDNNANGDLIEPYTTAQFSNITSIGPKTNDKNFQNTKDYIDGNGENPGNGSGLGLFQSFAQIRRASQLNIYNSVAVGWPVGLILDGELGNTRQLAEAGTPKAKLENVYMANMTAEGTDKNKDVAADKDVYWDWNTKSFVASKGKSYSTQFFENKTYNPGCEYYAGEDGQAKLNLTNMGNGALLNVVPSTPLVASWTDITNSWFDKVTYAGAFSGADDSWMTGWTNFDPQNTDY